MNRTANRMRGVRLCLAVCLLALACVAFAQSAESDIPLEYAVKATYLYKLAPFIDWPPGAFASVDAPFPICVVGDDPFDGFLAHAVTGRTFGTHPFVVRRLDALTGDSDCRIAYIGRLHSQTIAQALAAVQGKPVLTVTDSDILADNGSIMQFVIEGGRVRFDVDNAAAARNHLSISSKLLNLAAVVKNNG
ncbi:MAG TPA: YfiR family protein [Rhodanobacteraceae bacterium]|nr:YfiR family protein [Rhodanobacteraceae bacterium]